MPSSSASRRVLDASMAARLANIALGHVTREHPNAIQHIAPRSVHPIFYGSYDWHSCVHSYWLLASLLRLYPQMKEWPAVVGVFGDAFTPGKIASELGYLESATARGFERPYGWAWFLMLEAELMRHDSAQAHAWAAALHPLATLFVRRFREYLPKATYPGRAGTHGNTAFALALASEYAQTAKAAEFTQMILSTARGWYCEDRDCQAWEPSGEDFLSPALTEAECMRRVLPAAEFRAWFGAFLPRLAQGEPATLFTPASVSDRSDGRIVHLDGLNLSRAWCWRSLIPALDAGDRMCALAEETAERHLTASLAHVSGDYMGEHWLATFALLALRAGHEM